MKKVGRVFYLCNGQKEDCEKTDCYMNGGGCKHTTDVRYAKNFIVENPYFPDSYHEKETALDLFPQGVSGKTEEKVIAIRLNGYEEYVSKLKELRERTEQLSKLMRESAELKKLLGL